MAELLVPARNSVWKMKYFKFRQPPPGTRGARQVCGTVIRAVSTTPTALSEHRQSHRPVIFCARWERDHGGLFVATVAHGIAKTRKRRALEAQVLAGAPLYGLCRRLRSDGGCIGSRLEALPDVRLYLNAEVQALAAGDDALNADIGRWPDAGRRRCDSGYARQCGSAAFSRLLIAHRRSGCTPFAM